MRKAIILSENSGIKPHFYRYSFALLFGYSLLAITLIACSHPAQKRRQIPEAKEPKPAEQIMSDMKTVLRLTGEQEMNIRPIIEEQVKERNELVKKYQGRGRPGRDSLRDELKELRVSTENRLQYFLTNDQMIRYGYMQQEEDQRIAERTGEKTQEEPGQEKPKGRGRR